MTKRTECRPSIPLSSRVEAVSKVTFAAKVFAWRNEGDDVTDSASVYL